MTRYRYLIKVLGVKPLSGTHKGWYNTTGKYMFVDSIGFLKTFLNIKLIKEFSVPDSFTVQVSLGGSFDTKEELIFNIKRKCLNRMTNKEHIKVTKQIIKSISEVGKA